MKRAVIVTLVCINVALVAAVLLGTATPKAEAQALRGAPDYLMVTGRIGANNDAVYVLDMGQRRMGAFTYDRTTKRMGTLRGRELRRDFQQSAAAAE